MTSTEMTSTPTLTQEAALRAVLQRYFDGLYQADSGILRSVFHPDASYVCATDDPLVQLTMDEYFRVVDARVAPAATHQLRRDRIVSIEMAGPNAAAARVHCAIDPKYFTDLLTLIRVDDRWQIISKVFHYEPLEASN